jgi:hypothetical protein
LTNHSLLHANSLASAVDPSCYNTFPPKLAVLSTHRETKTGRDVLRSGAVTRDARGDPHATPGLRACSLRRSRTFYMITSAPRCNRSAALGGTQHGVRRPPREFVSITPEMLKSAADSTPLLCFPLHVWLGLRRAIRRAERRMRARRCRAHGTLRPRALSGVRQPYTRLTTTRSAPPWHSCRFSPLRVILLRRARA